MGALRVPWMKKVAAPFSLLDPQVVKHDVPCDDFTSCPANNTCCRLDSGAWACCPVPEVPGVGGQQYRGGDSILAWAKWVARVPFVYSSAFCLVHSGTPCCDLSPVGGAMSRKGTPIVPLKNTLVCPPLGCLLLKPQDLLPSGFHMHGSGVLSEGRQDGG